MASALRNDWPLAVMVAGTLATVAVGVACIVAVTAFGRDPLVFLAAAFACFGLIKLHVAIKGVRELRRFNAAQTAGAPAPGAEVAEDPRIDHGGPGRFKVYIAFKLAAATLAMVAAVIILVHGPAPAWKNATGSGTGATTAPADH